MLLKGCSMSGQRVDFTIGSCPVPVDADSIALIGEKDSPLIRTGTIVRGNEENNIFEGDLVYENDELIGTVVYVKGFVVQTLQGSLKKLHLAEHIKVIEGNYDSIREAVNCTERSQLLFSWRDNVFPLSSLMFKHNEFLIVSKFNDYYIKPEDILFSTGCLKKDNTLLFYGEFYKGGIVTLKDNMPCIKDVKGNFIELEENKE